MDDNGKYGENYSKYNELCPQAVILNWKASLYSEGGLILIREDKLISMEEARLCRTIYTSPSQHISIDKSHKSGEQINYLENIRVVKYLCIRNWV